VTFFNADEIERFSTGKVRVAFLVEFDFVSEKMGVWNGNTRLTVNDTLFQPLFGAGSIDGLSFANSTVSERVTFTIGGVKNDLLGLALTQIGEVQDRLVKVYLQSFDDDWQPIAAAPVIFFGYMQPPEIVQDEVTQDPSAPSPTQTISIAAENIYFNRSRIPGGRYSDRDQQISHPGDKIFEFMPRLVFKQFYYPDF
jgi:hypothetical protein